MEMCVTICVVFMHDFVLCGMMLMLHSLLLPLEKYPCLFDLLLNACCTCSYK